MCELQKELELKKLKGPKGTFIKILYWLATLCDYPKFNGCL